MMTKMMNYCCHPCYYYYYYYVLPWCTRCDDQMDDGVVVVFWGRVEQLGMLTDQIDNMKKQMLERFKTNGWDGSTDISIDMVNDFIKDQYGLKLLSVGGSPTD